MLAGSSLVVAATATCAARVGAASDMVPPIPVGFATTVQTPSFPDATLPPLAAPDASRQPCYFRRVTTLSGCGANTPDGAPFPGPGVEREEPATYPGCPGGRPLRGRAWSTPARPGTAVVRGPRGRR